MLTARLLIARYKYKKRVRTIKTLLSYGISTLNKPFDLFITI